MKLSVIKGSAFDLEGSLMQKENILGSLILITTSAQSGLSYLLAASQPAPLLAASQPAPDGGTQQISFFSELGLTFSFLPFRPSTIFILYCVPLVIQTACFIAMVAVLLKSRLPTTVMSSRQALYWALAFAVAAAPAYNVQTQDIWLSVVWGRMIELGQNPFNVLFHPSLAADLPLDHYPMTATYGPLWIALSSLVTAMTSGHPIASFVVLKIIILAAVLGSLCLVFILTNENVTKQLWAIVVLGWLPLSYHMSAAEGHNDVVMVLFALLWLCCLRSSNTIWGPIALSASVGIKYVTAPLAIVDLIYFWSTRRLSIASYAMRVLPALALMVATVLILLALGGFGRETVGMAKWRFLDPAGVLRILQHMADIDLPGGRLAETLPFALLCGALCVWELRRLSYTPSLENTCRASLALMATVMLVLAGHVWPWFFAWCIPFAALAPRFWFSWFIVGVACVSPFTMAHWWTFSVPYQEHPVEIMTLPMYLFGAFASLTYFYYVRDKHAI